MCPVLNHPQYPIHYVIYLRQLQCSAGTGTYRMSGNNFLLKKCSSSSRGQLQLDYKNHKDEADQDNLLAKKRRIATEELKHHSKNDKDEDCDFGNNIDHYVRRLLYKGESPDIFHDLSDSQIFNIINRTNSSNMTLLHYATILNSIPTIKKLLAYGASVHITNNCQRMPLQCAKSVSAAELLIAHGADIHAKDDEGETILSTAVGRSDYYLVKLLLQHKADFTDTKQYLGLPQEWTEEDLLDFLWHQ